VISRVIRINQIKKAVDAKQKEKNYPTYTIRNWRGNTIFLPIIRIGIENLMYGINNSRTTRQQLAYIRNTPDISSDIFNDPDSLKAQQAQEQILLQMIEKQGKDFENDLIDQGQKEPAIITYDGYIINGNRRTAALRKNNIEYMECVVLPEDANKKDFYELEQSLQISQDFKEEYHWINKLCNIRNGLQTFGYSLEAMAVRLGIKVNEIKLSLQMLNLVDKFLKWKNIPGEYDYQKLDNVEQGFEEIAKGQRSRKLKDSLKTDFVFAAFHLIEEPPPKGRLYSHIRGLLSTFDQLHSRVKKELPGSSDENESENSEDLPAEEGILEVILKGENKDSIPTIFIDPKQAEEISPLILSTIADIKAETKEQEEAAAVYEAVSSALRELQSLVIDNQSTKLESTKKKLLEIIRLANELHNKIEKVLVEK